MTNQLFCTDIRAFLSAIVDDELAADVRHNVERHLAECATCRAAIDRTERIEDMIRADAGLLSGEAAFPASAIDAVLARTVHADTHVHRGSGLMTWSGWLVAAAAVAASLILRSPGPEDVGSSQRDNVAQEQSRSSSLASVTTPATWQRSWTWDGNPTGAGTMTLPALTDASNPAPFVHAASPSPTTSTLHEAWRRSTLRSDLEALHAAALVLDAFIDIDEEGFRAVESVREVVLHDELIPRLSRIRTALDGEERGLITAAETLLFRIIHDPLDEADLADMRDLVRRADLAEALRRIGDRGLARRSL